MAAGQTISDAEAALIARIDPWNNENALKVDKDRYAAFPLGVVSEKEIIRGMAAIVFGPDPVPAGYTEKYILNPQKETLQAKIRKSFNTLTKGKDAIKKMTFVTVMGKTVTFDDHKSAGRFVVLQSVLDKKVGVADIVEVK